MDGVFTPDDRDTIWSTFDRTQMHGFRTSPEAAALMAGAFSGTIRLAVEQEAERIRQALPRRSGSPHESVPVATRSIR